jgi:hypothetical protein
MHTYLRQVPARRRQRGRRSSCALLAWFRTTTTWNRPGTTPKHPGSTKKSINHQICCLPSPRCPQSLHYALGAGRTCGRQDAGAEAVLEPAPEPEPEPAAGSTSLEHCCRGGRSSGYWVGASPRSCFFINCVSSVSDLVDRRKFPFANATRLQR